MAFLCRYRDGCPFARIVDSIIQQIAENAIYQGKISLHADISRHIHPKRHAALLQGLGAFIHDFGQHRGNINLFQAQHIRGIVQPVEGGYVL